jgi:hypothetical protein
MPFRRTSNQISNWSSLFSVRYPVFVPGHSYCEVGIVKWYIFSLHLQEVPQVSVFRLNMTPIVILNIHDGTSNSHATANPRPRRLLRMYLNLSKHGRFPIPRSLLLLEALKNLNQIIQPILKFCYASRILILWPGRQLFFWTTCDNFGKGYFIWPVAATTSFIWLACT